MAIAQLTVVPLGSGATSLSDAVAGVLKAIAATGIQYELTPMSTILEGSLAEIYRAVQAAHEAAFAGGVARVSTSLTIDDRRDRPIDARHKVEVVKQKMGR